MSRDSLSPGLTRRALLTAAGATALAPALFVSSAKAERLTPLTRALVLLDPPKQPPEFSFQTATGEKQTLADYRNQGVVLNIWATWCVPCLAEMPALNQLAGFLRDFSVNVLPISIDTKGLAAVRKYYTAHQIENLPILLDPSGDIADAFKIDGIPATFVINRHGRLVAHCLGAAEWDSPDAVATIRRLTSQGNEPI